jgi:hypothetical protein
VEVLVPFQLLNEIKSAGSELEYIAPDETEILEYGALETVDQVVRSSLLAYAVVFTD